MNSISMLAGMPFKNLDRAFADFLCRREGTQDPLLWTAAAMASAVISAGHICCRLPLFEGKPWREVFESLFPDGLPDDASFAEGTFPAASEFAALPGKFPKSIAAYPGEIRNIPLVLDSDGRLYLNRYFEYERKLAEKIRILCSRPFEILSCGRAEFESASPYFSSPESPNFQKLAAFAACGNAFTVVTGGPGTGKTTAVAAMLILLLRNNPDLRIMLCAPTGKAQARLAESIREQIAGSELSDDLKTRLSALPCSTIHHLLGMRFGTSKFRYGERNPLPADVLVVDEASMVSLPLMSALFQALRTETKVILLGDRDQLASVEAGAVLADLCDSGTPDMLPSAAAAAYSALDSGAGVLNDSLPLSGHIVSLKTNHRAFQAPDVCEIAGNIAENTLPPEPLAEKICALKADDFFTEETPSESALESELRRIFQTKMISCGSTLHSFGELPELVREGSPESFETAFVLTENFRILCALRKSPFGVESINSLAMRILGLRGDGSAPGLPVIVLSNDPVTGLSNGDTGLLWKTPEGRTEAFFRDGKAFRHFAVPVLPAFEPVFAMTVHKSQGSGFENTLVVMPHRDSPVLTRELFYTAVTRAKKHLRLWCGKDLLGIMLERKTVRHSGLEFRLKEI